MLVQKCPMCLETKEVVSSHLHPAALYLSLRSAEDASPVRVGDDVIMHTDRQMQQPLLCRGCEDILNKGGETWTIPKLATATKSFPLYDILMKVPAAVGVDVGGIYLAADNPEIDVTKLTHFGMGIFWKASVNAWKAKEKEPMIQLGPYSDSIRTWLRGERGFPENICISIMLSKPERALIALHGPVMAYRKVWRSFLLYVPGIAFTLYTGKLLEPEMKETCFYGNTMHPIFVSDQVTGQIWARLAKQFHESRKTKSYMAAKAKRTLQRRT